MASRWSLGIGSRRPIKVSRLLLIILFIGITLLFILQPWSDRFRITRSPQMGDGNDIILPENLEHIVLTRFDSLVDKGLILYEPSQPETYEHDGFQFQFRIIPFLDKKPISSPDSKDRKAPGGPLANPPTDEIITSIGPTHRLLLNKYCIYRPMLILPTTKYLPQTSDLDITDITAAWTVLHALTTPQLVIYNCGPAAGSSLGHKHLQIFPVPNSGDITLFPSLATSTTAITRNIPGVPFAHFIQRLPPSSTPAHVFEIYLSLLSETRLALNSVGATDYNVAFTTEWIVLIPRRTAVWGGPFGANAAGMLGLVSVPSEAQREMWADLGYTDYLVRLGVPVGIGG